MKKFQVGNTVYQRSPHYRIGKEIGGQLYIHKDYATRVIPYSLLAMATGSLPRDFNYNCVMFAPKREVIRFDEAPDFDTAREPKVGNYINVFLPNLKIKQGHSEMIWHHKWMWVDDDYQGFDVDEAYKWSKYWTQHISHPSGSRFIWEQQIKNIK